MANPVLVAKSASFIKKHWKEISILLLGCFVAVILFPVFVLSAFLPSSTEDKYAGYKDSAKTAQLDWIELVVFDTVRYDNDFSKATPGRTVFDFMKLSYIVYEKDVSTERVTRIGENGKSESYVTFKYGGGWYDSEGISKLEPGSYSYKETTKTEFRVTDRGTASSYAPIVTALRRLGYSVDGEMSISGAMKFVKGLGGNELYDVQLDPLTLLDLIAGFDADHKQWVFDLYTALIDENDSFGSTREFYNTDPTYMASIVLDPGAYRLGDIGLLTGDKDIDEIFAGRLAALAEDYGKDEVAITSGYRSYDEQKAIWDKTSVERRGKYVAAPGHSRHQYKIAADVKGWLLYVTNEKLVKYGLWKPMSYEDWHIEPIETKPN